MGQVAVLQPYTGLVFVLLQRGSVLITVTSEPIAACAPVIATKSSKVNLPGPVPGLLN
jgi:hypothetical protein